MAFSRDTVSTAEFLSSTETARTLNRKLNNNTMTKWKNETYFPVNLEPHISLSTTLNDRADGHQSNDKCLALLNRDMHLLSDVGPTQEVPSGNDAVRGQ